MSRSSVEFGELRQFLHLDSAPAPTTADDESTLADLSADDAAKLAAELDEVQRVKEPLQPTSDGLLSKPEDAGLSETIIKQPGQAEAEEFETGMS